jgi:mannosyl-oligosaccharide glucosidase
MMKELFPLLDRHYNWFRRTQAGNFTAYSRPSGASPEGYRWKGRTPGHTFASGLDDYPRAEPPHPGELHVDALAWVGSSARALQQVADYLEEDSTVYTKQLDDVLHNLEVIHWSSEHSAYCDSTISGNGQYQHVCHLGYTSLMPLLLGHMNASHPHLPAMLDLLHSPDKLWSPHGLRSLSAADPLYGTDEDYWRGAVWMNLNVLAVQQLHGLDNATAAGARARQLAAALRRNVVDTVFASWAQTGFVWEQYNDRTGAGQHSRAFTGWTACVILLMGLEDAAPPAADDGGGGGNDVSTPVPDDAVSTPAPGARRGWVVVPVVLVFVLVAGLVLFRKRVLSVCSGLVARCADIYNDYRGVGGSRVQEYQALNLDDLTESDTEEGEEVDNPLH